MGVCIMLRFTYFVLFYSALLKLLYDTVNNTAITQLYQDLAMKCLWKVVKNFVEWDEDLDYERVLTDIHAFLRVSFYYFFLFYLCLYYIFKL